MKWFIILVTITCFLNAVACKFETLIYESKINSSSKNLTVSHTCIEHDKSKKENIVTKGCIWLDKFLDFLQKLKLNLSNISQLTVNSTWPMNEEVIKNDNAQRSHLYYLNCSGNNITDIKNDTFYNMKNLETLVLADNKISLLPTDLLNDTKNLIKLDLSYNFITTIPRELFENTNRLEELHLRGNRIMRVNPLTFNGLTHLKILDLSFNNISFHKSLCEQYEHISDDSSSFLINNLALHIPEVLVNFTSNNISGVPFLPETFSCKLGCGKVKLLLKNNPIKCDCQAYDLIEYFRSKSTKNIKNFLEIENYTFCDVPDKQISIHFSSVNISDIPCNVTDCEICPHNCNCTWYKKINKTTMKCEHATLETMPERVYGTEVELWLGHNSIKTIEKIRGHFIINLLSIDHNEITRIENITHFKKLKILKLNNNKLKILEQPVIQFLEKLTNITLGNNPWNCSDCRNKDLVDFLQRTNNVYDVNEIKCSSSNTFVKLSTIISCEEESDENRIIKTVLTLIVVLSIAIALSIYIIYKVKEILLMRNPYTSAMPTVTYDAFISYSHENETFVAELIEKLENRSNPFKICLHSRNWEPGEFIVQQMVESVKQSRMTIVILSEAYSKSDWCKVEFQLAFTEMMLHKGHKIIVIWYENEDPTHFSLDSKFEDYMHMCTYLKSDDQHFLSKLVAAIENKMANRVRDSL